MEINRNAEQNLNKKAETLLTSLVVNPVIPVISTKKRPPQIDVHVSANIVPVGEVKRSRVDPYGNEVAKEFNHNGNIVTIKGEDYQKMKKIAQAIQRTPDFRDSVSLDVLVDLTFEWMRGRYAKTLTTSLCEHLIAKCEKLLDVIEIWIPIAHTRMQSDLRLGNVTFRTITRAMLERYHNGLRERLAEPDLRVDARFDDEHREMLGFVAATMTLTAEPKRAYEIAMKEAGESIAMLRCLSPRNALPFYVSYSAPLGERSPESFRYFLVRDDRIVYHAAGVDMDSLSEWNIGDSDVALMRTYGLDRVSELLSSKSRTPFEREVFTALSLYSRSSLHKNLGDKLAYILTPLEGVLMLDQQQPIQDLIERLAILVDRDLEERKEAMKTIKAVYDRKLAFVYGEHSNKDVELLGKFMLLAWAFFVSLIGFAGEYRTKSDFLRAIDNRKLSGELK